MTPDPLALPVGAGHVLVDPTDGSPLQFVDPAAPERRFLLDEGDGFHSAEHRWGSGFVITDAGSARWRHPLELSVDDAGVHAAFQLTATLRLVVTRTGGDHLLETYRFTNAGDTPVRITGLAINIPINDRYASAKIALGQAVHAHVWTGGADAWVLAEPMSCTGALLALSLEQGALWSYSIESRNQGSSSNVRGHLLLQATDRARNAEAFGGQPEIVVPPGEAWTLQWAIGFHPDRESFVDANPAALSPTALHAEVGEPIGWTGEISDLTADDAAEVQAIDGETTVTSHRHGVVHVGTVSRRTAVLFHHPLPELVRRRVQFILDHQRPTERTGSSAAAFVPYDIQTGLTQTVNGWPDWSDGAERLAMPTLLQEAQLRGWVDDAEEVAAALDAYGRFARESLLDETAAPRWGSMVETDVRIYNSPWLAHFFATQFRLAGDHAAKDDLDLAAAILERSFDLGAGEHLSIGHPEAVVLVTDLLSAAGDGARSDALRARLVAQAEHFLGLAGDLPQHEVNYEQSMVAPLVSLYATVERLEGEGRFHPAIEVAVRWLRAFGGPQPHIRLNEIGIRHWDGYWFGRDRQWGDVFPHHWSVLTAVALTQLPGNLRTDESDRAADQIFHANLANIFDDGSATCAFVLPSTVDGRPAYRADSLANDQDWPLTLWLRLLPTRHLSAHSDGVSPQK